MLLPHPLVIEELRRGEHRLLSRRTGGNDAIADARRPARGARIRRQLELILERQPEGRRREERVHEAQLRHHRRARCHEETAPVQPELGVQPPPQLDQRLPDHLGPVLRHGLRAARGVAERLANQQIAGAARLVRQPREAPGRERENGQDEERDEHGGQLRAITRAQRRDERRNPGLPSLGHNEPKDPNATEQRDVEQDDQHAAHQQRRGPSQRHSQVHVPDATG